ncbi:MAG: hypothetical protein KF833_10820 [Verrucomicrobiae bacterium]|nr:hypothetical protein [Verrucomicrobiae bacterium]
MTSVAGPPPHAIVVGAGIAGCAAAISLAHQQIPTTLVAAPPPPHPPIGETLPAAARPLLRDLGAWTAFARAPHRPAPGTVSVWASADPVAIDALHDRNGPGWQLDRRRFEADLLETALAAGVTLLPATLVRHVSRRPDLTWELHTDRTPSTLPLPRLPARLLVDATGRRATPARALGARRHTDDRLVCAYLRVPPPPDAPRPEAASLDARTWVESVPDGWWYTALPPDGHRVVAFLTDADLIAPPDSPPDSPPVTQAFFEKLEATQHLRRLVPPLREPSLAVPRLTSAATARLSAFHGNDWIAVGDAALSFDPLSSQGMLTALYTGLRGGQALAAHARGDPSALTAYADRIHRIRDAYLRHRHDAYRSEPRWPTAPFWSRRQP